ncbi:MAG: Uma2 family endonuclease [Acidobacteriaceae bacterium]|nr:Uma2 family endonuclease [Acidobacteriaceae bacterium]
MATVALVSVSEYLNTSYRPDQELLEGRLVERNVGEYDHSNLQGAVVGWMRQRQHEWKIRVLPEQRLQVSLRRFRVPDVCVISRDQELEAVFTRPPLLVIEILSKDDTLRSMQERIDDYRTFGIQNIWVLDPVRRRAYVCTYGDFREPDNETLEVPGTPILVALRDLFSELD